MPPLRARLAPAQARRAGVLREVQKPVLAAEAAGEEVSAAADMTRRWQAGRLRRGLCQWCGSPRGEGSSRYCPLHHAWHKRLMREWWARRRSRGAVGGG